MAIIRIALLAGSVVAAGALGAAQRPSKPGSAAAALSVTLNQGEVARWPDLAARRCALGAKIYAAVDSVCYYPFDVAARPGRYPIAAIDDQGKRHRATAIVRKVERPHVDITLRDAGYIDVTPENQRRALHEREAVLKLFAAKGSAARFSLPLGAPASPLPKNENDFGSDRTFNGKVQSQHTGRDYPVNEGSPVKAIADGTVVLAGDQFITGNSVYIEHGDGMVSASFHLSSIGVNTGDEVKRGQTIGKVGATGRVSGAHLHLGIRWLGARVDPQPLIESPLQLHNVGEAPAVTERKEEKAQNEPKESNATIRRDDEG